MTDPTTINESFGKLRAIETELGALFIEREEVVRAMLLALLSREHLALIGPPGTAKSMLIIELAKRVGDSAADGTQALQHDAYDVQEFDRAVETYQRLEAAVSSGGEELHSAPALIRDLFWSFHKRAPRINENVRPASLMNSPHRPRLNRSKTSANARRKRARTPGARERAAARLEEALDADDDERDRAIRLAARQGMAEALEEAEAIQNAIAAFGGGFSTGNGGCGTPREMTAQEKIELAMRVMRSPKLKLIAEMCGRFTHIAMSVQKSRVNHPPSEITSITIGNDLAHLLPGEVALLGDPDLEDLFYLKFAERRLLQYELEGRESEGRGPIILALDESGSMSETLGGVVKEAWGKSVMLGLLAIARRQKRDLAVIHFSGPDQLQSGVFPKGECSTLELIDAVEFF